MIPKAYFDYLRSSDASIITSVFSHNVYDIFSLAALMIQASDQVVRDPVLVDAIAEKWNIYEQKG